MYIDPGSGSLIIQALIAAIVVVPIFLRHQIGRVFRSVHLPGRHVQGTPPTDDAAPSS